MSRRQREIERELQDHLRREAEALEAAGLSAAEARRKAALAFGSADRWREEGHAARGGARLGAWLRDFRLALRGLRRAPGFAAVAILTLGLGIGANTALFSVVNAVLLRPLPYPQPQRLRYVWEGSTRSSTLSEPFSYPDFRDLRHAPFLQGMAAYTVTDLPLTGGGEPARVRVAAVSANLFALLGVRAAAGRTFLPGEDRAGALDGLDAVTLSAGWAKRRYGSAAAALGRRLTLNGRPFQVVGVMPPGFQFPLNDEEDLWATIAPLTVSTDGAPVTEQRDNHFLKVVARLAPGASDAAATDALFSLARGLAAAHPGSDKYLRPRLVTMLADYTDAAQPVLWLLLGAAGCILLIACVNVAGLLLARAVRRGPEFALRTALGASRGDLLRQTLCESLALGLLGAAAGLGIAAAALPALLRLGPANLVRLQQASLSPAVLGFALVLGVGTGLLFGMAPAGSGWRRRQVGARASHRAPARAALRRVLISGQFGLALAVLIAAGLLLHSLGRIVHTPPGLDPNQVLTTTITIPDSRYPTPDDQARFFRELTDQVRVQPGIAAAAAAMPAPFLGGNMSVDFEFAGHPLPAPERPSARIGVITPGYFHALAVPLLAGRDFTAADAHAGPQVAIVNQAFARAFLRGRPALGARIIPGLASYAGPDPPRAIVGIVADFKSIRLAAPVEPMMFVPQAQVPFDGMVLTVRARPGAEAQAASAIRAVVHRLDADIPIYDLQPMTERMKATSASAGFAALLLGLFAGLAVLLAAVGLYAVLAQSVAARRREIGIRLALGADRRRIAGMVVGEGLALAGLGALGGLLLAAVSSRALASQLYATSAHDPAAFLGALGLQFVVGAVACFVPARRAASADPLTALRED